MAKKKTRKPDEILNRGGLMSYIENGVETFLGDLLIATEHGVYDEKFGKLDVTGDEARAHNTSLSEALICGLDEFCEVGHGGTLYLSGDPPAVRTRNGDLVTTDFVRRGKRCEFRRNGKTFEGGIAREGVIRFIRIA